MVAFLAYFILGYLLLGLLFYVWGHPQVFPESKKLGGMESKGAADFPSRHTAHAVQTVNFLLHDIPRLRRKAVAAQSFAEIYAAAVRRAFDPRKPFITTGTPHSRAIYLRNYAWFYPTLLDANTIIDAEDGEHRIDLIVRGLSIILRNGSRLAYPTTFIPLTSRRFAAVNYDRKPSDSLLGVLAGIQELLKGPGRAQSEGRRLLDEGMATLRFQLDCLLKSLEPFRFGEVTTLLIDRDESRSSATDTRIEKRRFVANANVWATLVKASRLGMATHREIEETLGRTIESYKQELLAVFGAEGYMVNTLDLARNVTLDFCHVEDGFWTFESERETEVFRNTADLFLRNRELQDDSGRCYLISATNPEVSFVKRYTASSYHGRSVWPAFNVEFADRLLSMAQEHYQGAARRILEQIRTYVETLGYYPEILRPDGRAYRTWIYKSARADSWFPRFVSVCARSGLT